MNKNLKQAIITLFFAGQIVAVWALNREDKPQEDVGAEEALKRYGFHLRESAKDCGIDFVHESPRKLDEKLTNIMPIIASMGAGVSIVDYDKDGLLDIYVVTSVEGGKNRLYRNLGNGKFRDVAQELGIADLNQLGEGVCQGAVWGDFDNDGFEDLFVYRWGKPELYRNMKGKSFENVTQQANLPRWVNANSAIWLDYDCDGFLDLFIAGYWPDNIDLWHLDTTKMMPESFEYAKNGGRKYLLRNRGDGTFEDVTDKLKIRSTRWTLGLAAADFCGNGYPDIVLANDYGVSEYLCNKNGKEFEEIGERTKIGQTPKSGMGASLGDVFNTGQLAIYVTNITEPGNLVQGNNLWVPDQQTPGQPARYINQAGRLKVERGGWSWGAQFGDLNNDGRLDLYLTNGYISGDKKNNFWYDYGLIAGGHKYIIGDAKNWPTIGTRSLSGYQAKCIWWNRGSEFVDIAGAVGVTDTYDGRGVALADLFNRGVLDAIVSNQNGPLLLYKNTVAAGRDWVEIELEGTASNRSAIGAIVRVFWKMAGQERVQEQVQVVSGGSGYASQNMRRLHFGLGHDARIEKIVIQWPIATRTTQTIETPEKNVVLKIKEGTR
jgi:hypothetical protein